MVPKLGDGFGKGTWYCTGGFRNCCNEVGLWVRSKVIVGKGAEAEIVAMLDEQGKRLLEKKLGFVIPSALGMDPESNIRAADEVVETITIAA